ncbi:MAG: TrkA family potassium uptake protein [Bacteroidales bacterium]
MRYMIIGLGNLGRALAENLSSVGHDVIGVDIDMHHIDLIKTKIEGAICIDSADIEALKSLPSKDMDAIFVCYSKDFGLSVQTVAYLKNIGAKNLIVRVISPIHETVLKSIGIERIMRPELSFANTFTSEALVHDLFLDRFRITETDHVFKIKTPPIFIGKSLEIIKIKENFGLSLIGIDRPVMHRNLLGIAQKDYVTIDNFDKTMVIAEGDVLLLFGKLPDLRGFEKL